MYILDLSHTKAQADVDLFNKEHRTWMMEQIQHGIVLFLGGKKSTLGGVMGFKSMEKKDLMALLATDPYVVNEVAEYAVVETNITVVQPGLEMLKTV